MLPQEAINKYKKLFEAHYGVKLSDAEATRRANNLVGFYKAVNGSAHFGNIKLEQKPHSLSVNKNQSSCGA